MLSVLVAGASDSALADALAVGPDWLVLALAPEPGDQAASLAADTVRRWAHTISRQPRRPRLFLRLPSLDWQDAANALGSALEAGIDGIMLGRVVGRRSVEHLGARLAVLEAEHGLEDGATRIIASIDSAEGALAVRSLAVAGPRLAAMTWDEAALKADLGLQPDLGQRPEPCRQLSAALVLTAAVAKVPAIDTAGPLEGAPEDLARARRDGFAGKLTLDPGQVAAIGEA